MKGRMNWQLDCAYNEAQKRTFHATVQSRLRILAIIELRLEPNTFDVPCLSG